MDTNPINQNQILLVNKPLGWSSFDIVNKTRSNLKYFLKENNQWENGRKNIKVGHAGTLDPLASGLLIVATGDQTKQISSFMNLEKEYDAVFCLGATTPSLDTETLPTEFKNTDYITKSDLEKTIEQHFMGPISQIPPIFSAIKINGRRAYQLARNEQNDPESKKLNLEKIAPKTITIHSFDIQEFDFINPNQLPNNHYLLDKSTKLRQSVNHSLIYSNPQSFFNHNANGIQDNSEIKLCIFKARIVCSKGTYIRSIARDIAQKFGTNGYLLSLTRTRIGNYKLENSQTIDQLTF